MSDKLSRRSLRAEQSRVVEESLKRNGPDLLTYLAGRTEIPEDAADVLIDTFVTAWRRADKFPIEPSQSRMWLFGIAKNTLANHLRGQRRRAALADSLRAAISLAAPAERERDPFDVANATHTAETVRGLVRKLPAADRDLLILIAWDGFSVADAAELLGIPASTARSRYARLKEQLRRQIEADSVGRDFLRGP